MDAFRGLIAREGFRFFPFSKPVLRPNEILPRAWKGREDDRLASCTSLEKNTSLGRVKAPVV